MLFWKWRVEKIFDRNICWAIFTRRQVWNNILHNILALSAIWYFPLCNKKFIEGIQHMNCSESFPMCRICCKAIQDKDYIELALASRTKKTQCYFDSWFLNIEQDIRIIYHHKERIQASTSRRFSWSFRIMGSIPAHNDPFATNVLQLFKENWSHSNYFSVQTVELYFWTRAPEIRGRKCEINPRGRNVRIYDMTSAQTPDTMSWTKYPPLGKNHHTSFKWAWQVFKLEWRSQCFSLVWLPSIKFQTKFAARRQASILFKPKCLIMSVWRPFRIK